MVVPSPTPQLRIRTIMSVWPLITVIDSLCGRMVGRSTRIVSTESMRGWIDIGGPHPRWRRSQSRGRSTATEQEFALFLTRRYVQRFDGAPNIRSTDRVVDFKFMRRALKVSRRAVTAYREWHRTAR